MTTPALVVGAAGRIGPSVVAELARRGVSVRGVVRRPDQMDQALRNGCDDVVVADLRDPDQAAAAVRGARAVFHIGPQFHPDEARIGVTLVEAAATGGVERFVFSGVVRPDNGLANHTAKLPVQQALYRSGLSFTVLQPVTLMQNLRGLWPTIVQTGEIAEPVPVDSAVARVDYRDVAEVAAAAITSEKLDAAVLELAAETHTNRQLAELASRFACRHVRPRTCSFAQWAEGPDAPDDESSREAMAAVFADTAAHGSPGNALILRTVLGRPPRSVESYLRELAGG